MKLAIRYIKDSSCSGRMCLTEQKSRSSPPKRKAGGENEGVVPDVQVQIEMKQQSKKQRQVR